VVIKFNPIEFCGLKQIFDKSESVGCPYSSSVKSDKRTTGNPTLITSGVFRICRHPLYLFTILALTITPAMSLDRLAFIIYTCLYASIGVPFEERKLVQIFGQAYTNYQQHVPAIIPFPMLKTKQN
jgi:protein-S-isoprenylcysteine O-methyltransferase Ste14